jgi:hypothetical protein
MNLLINFSSSMNGIAIVVPPRKFGSGDPQGAKKVAIE